MDAARGTNMRLPGTGDSPKVRRAKKPAYRSKLEKTVAEQLTRAKIKYEYESTNCVIHYKKPSTAHSYLADFRIPRSDGDFIYIEAKGIWDYDDRYKHFLLRIQHPEKDIRFVFQRATNKIRKGSKTTYADICNGDGKGIFKGITWQYGDKGKIPKEWLNE